MVENKLNNTELEVLGLVSVERLSISQIASRLQKSLSWMSECINHLEYIGFVELEKRGLSRFVTISSNAVGKKLLLLMIESPHLNLNEILSNYGLTILPLLLPPGYRAREITERTSISLRSVRNSLKHWNSMGVVRLDKKTKNYTVNPRQKNIIQFIRAYSEFRNERMLKKNFPKAMIVWEWRDEFLFSNSEPIEHKNFIQAAVTRLDELGYDVLHTSEYYFYGPTLNTVSEEEALVQSMKVNSENPRVVRFILKAIKHNKINKEILLDFGRKYGLKTRLDKEVLSIA